MREPNEELKEQTFLKVQAMQRETCRLLTLYIVEHDIDAFYEGIYENRASIFDLVTALTSTLEAYIRYQAQEKGILVQEEIQSLALSHENMSREEAFQALDEFIRREE